MHASLTPRTNYKLIALWSVLAAACLPSSTTSVAPLFVAFGSGGAIAGSLQSRALRERQDSFRQATAVLEVRRAFAASPTGKVALAMAWIAAGALLALALTRAEFANPQSVLGCYAAFALARECASLPGVLALARAT